jgi:hypothetical protein
LSREAGFRSPILQYAEAFVVNVQSEPKARAKVLAPAQRIRLMEEKGLLKRATRRRVPASAPAAIKKCCWVALRLTQPTN